MNIITHLKNRLLYNFRKRTVKKKEDALNWGIIGLGYMGNVFAKALSLSPYSVLHSIASRSENKSETFAKKYCVPNYYGSYEDICKESCCDVIYIATPLMCHYDNIKMALNNGKNVLCEKPIVAHKEQLSELIALSKEKGLYLIEGMWSLFLPTYQKADYWIQSDKIGKIKSIEIDLSKNESAKPNDLRFKPNDCGGVLLDFGIYAISSALHFMNKEIHINSFETETYENGVDKYWHICLNDGKITSIVTIASDREGKREATIYGTKGKIVFPAQFNRTNKILLYDKNGALVEKCVYNYISDGFEHEIKQVYNILREPCMLYSSLLSSNMRTLEIINALKSNKL